jgi:hypothetical protein
MLSGLRGQEVKYRVLPEILGERELLHPLLKMGLIDLRGREIKG